MIPYRRIQNLSKNHGRFLQGFASQMARMAIENEPKGIFVLSGDKEPNRLLGVVTMNNTDRQALSL